MKITGKHWNALIILVIAAMAFVASGCNKGTDSEHPTNGEHPTKSEHPTTGEHPDHPKK
jgi:hypothetical protein